MADEAGYLLSEFDASWVVNNAGQKMSEQREFTRPAQAPFRLYRFTLLASLASGTASANILEMDGTDTGIDADVQDPLGIFASLTAVGSAGICVLYKGKYYVIQAPCPT